MTTYLYAVNPSQADYYSLDSDAFIVQFDYFPDAHEIMQAPDNPQASVVSLSDMTPAEVTILDVASQHAVDVDDTITKYAERLQDIYDSRTAGAHTFTGVLFMMLQELEGK